MVPVGQLWLPIVVSAVAIFFASFVAWMVLPHHKKDVKVLPDEKVLTQFLEKTNIAPGTYMWPNCNTPEEMKTDAYKARFEAGPWGSINVLGTKPNFGKNLLLVTIFYVAVSVFVAYVTGEARAAGAGFSAVFQIAGAVAILGYCAGAIPNAIFFSKPGRFVLTDFMDSLAYGLITGAVFAWLWPAAGVAAVG